MKHHAHPALHRLADMSNGVVMVKRLDGDILEYVNEFAASAIGHTVEEMLNRPSIEFYPQAEDYAKDDWEIYRKGEPRLGYVEQYVANGTTHYLLTNKWPETIDGVAYVTLVSIDITAVYQALQKATDLGRSIPEWKEVDDIARAHQIALDAL